MIVSEEGCMAVNSTALLKACGLYISGFWATCMALCSAAKFVLFCPNAM